MADTVEAPPTADELIEAAITVVTTRQQRIALRRRVIARRLRTALHRFVCGLALISPILALPFLEGVDTMSMLTSVVVPLVCSFLLLLILSSTYHFLARFLSMYAFAHRTSCTPLRLS